MTEHADIAAAPDRPWLTLLHGFSQNAKLFDRQRAHFEQRYRVFCPELLGHGERDVAAADYSLLSHAQDVMRQMSEHGIERTHFWGTHTGAAVGLWLALEQPDLIASLALEGAVVPGIDMPMVTARVERARAIARASGVRASMEDWFEHAEWFRAMRNDPVAFRADEQRDLVLAFQGRPLLADPPPTSAYSLADRVGDVACPVLIYNGSEDIQDFKQTAAWLAARVSLVQQAELAGLGGFPAWESPSRVNALVQEFLSSLDT